MDSRRPADMQRERGRPAFGSPADIPPYLLTPEGLEAPLPEVTELPPETPRAQKPAGGRLLEALRTGALGHREPAHRGFDPHTAKSRHAPIATLREHRVHGRGQ